MNMSISLLKVNHKFWTAKLQTIKYLSVIYCLERLEISHFRLLRRISNNCVSPQFCHRIVFQKWILDQVVFLLPFIYTDVFSSQWQHRYRLALDIVRNQHFKAKYLSDKYVFDRYRIHCRFIYWTIRTAEMHITWGVSSFGDKETEMYFRSLLGSKRLCTGKYLIVWNGSYWIEVSTKVHSELLNFSTTDINGRANLLPVAETGIYRLRLHTRSYFYNKGLDTFWPIWDSTFNISNPFLENHIPVTFSQFGFTTYRGSSF